MFDIELFSSFLLLVLTIYITNKYLYTRKHKRNSLGLKQIPVVKGALPIVGHGTKFSKDIIAFIQEAYKTYGKIFRLKIFRTNMVVVCDQSAKAEYFKATEDQMSLYDVLDRLFFADAFSDDPKKLSLIIQMVKKTIAIRYNEFAPKIMSQAKKMVDRLKKKVSNEKLDISEEMIRFVACTSAQCFIALELTEEFYEALVKFTQLLNKIVVLTYFLPKSFLRFTINRILRRYRLKMTNLLAIEIQKYRKDLNRNHSLVLRKCVDYKEETTGRTLTDQDIGNIIVCLLYVSSENTALGLVATLTDLACNPEYWQRIAEESSNYLASNDHKSLFASPLLEACVMESARMNTHIFALNRRPKTANASICGYYVGDADSVALCEPFLMIYGGAEEIYKEARKYNPARFLDPVNESMQSINLMTWGSGHHLCPGKMFAVYEIKAAVALITKNFERFDLSADKIGPLNYFSPSAFAERKVQVQLKALDEKLETERRTFEVNHRNKQYQIQYFKDGGWLIRNCLTQDEQTSLYKYTIDISADSAEHQEIMQVPDSNPFPVLYYNLVYTGKSNCKEIPDRWLEWAEEMWQILRKNAAEINFPIDERERYEFDSVYAQLFASESVIKKHKDQYVTWGLSVNIGASCDFLFGEDLIRLNTGDVFVADFSKVEHAVLKVHDSTTPGWFSGDEEGLEEKEKLKTFGRVRCSVQIRNVSRVCMRDLMTTEEFKKIINK